MRFLCLALCLASSVSAETVPQLTAPLSANIDLILTPKLILDTPEAVRINAYLAALDAGDLSCPGASRDVEVMHFSAEFYGIRVTEGAMCEGAAHPFYAQVLFTFDLTTGDIADWAKLAPQSLHDTTAANYDKNHPFTSQALTDFYLAHIDLEPECADWFASPQPMEFALNAEKKVIIVAPSELPYAGTACSNYAEIPLDEAKTLGFDARIIAALETGTR